MSTFAVTMQKTITLEVEAESHEQARLLVESDEDVINDAEERFASVEARIEGLYEYCD